MNTYDRLIKSRRVIKGVSCRNIGCQVMEHEVPRDGEAELLKLRAEAEAAAKRQLAAQLDEQKRQFSDLMAKTCKQWDQTLEVMQEQIKQQLLELSIKIAQVIVGRELPDTEMIQRIMEETLAPVSDLQGVRVRLSPADMALVSSESQFSARWQRVEMIEDSSLKAGDVVIESRNGYFDGSISERLACLAEALLANNGKS